VTISSSPSGASGDVTLDSYDAAAHVYLEQSMPPGPAVMRVLRTDGAPAFVQMLQAAGHQTRLLDVRVDDFGGPYDAVLADAVLLHLTREQFVDVLQRHDRPSPAGASWPSRSRRGTARHAGGQARPPEALHLLA